jgi:uncharacterized protein YybS (DUF2232 family)
MEALIAIVVLLTMVTVGLGIKLIKTLDDADQRVRVTYQTAWKDGFEKGRASEKAVRVERKKQLQLLTKQMEQLKKELAND